MTEVQIANDFAESASRHLAERLEYDSMSVLLIYWKENDLHPDSELQDLRRLFEKKFNFTVTSFPIPPTKSEQRLNYQLAAFVADYCHASRSLIIVYYADHCFSSPKGEAQWAA
ncbi:hypothetical protein BDV97DRAFT_346225 [Delphinella strobiligena]|nr:hypothetical protein BDV97DRAFT_346225 [Delphinella strobiligena]